LISACAGPAAATNATVPANASSFLIDMKSSLAQYLQVWMSVSAESIRRHATDCAAYAPE
jgi:hypothetical protein